MSYQTCWLAKSCNLLVLVLLLCDCDLAQMGHGLATSMKCSQSGNYHCLCKCAVKAIQPGKHTGGTSCILEWATFVNLQFMLSLNPNPNLKILALMILDLMTLHLIILEIIL